ncbi:MAG: TonB-dependent receptor [Vicinamibacteria bacterium]
MRDRLHEPARAKLRSPRLGALGLLLLLLALPASAQNSGRVTGKVLDSSNAISLPGAVVEVVGQDRVAHTDMDGYFVLVLPAGEYQLKASFSGYKERVATGVSVAAGGEARLDFALALPSFSEEITVAAATSELPGSQVAALLERKRAGSIGEALAADEMRKNADSDAAAAMQRVTGVSVVDGQYVFVRGLGERYSNTALNGAVLPTTEPDKRVVPLDLFPAGLVESVKVTKSYLPDRPAEFAGGLIEIEPISFPAKNTFSISFEGGWNSQTTFEDVLSYPGGSLDRLGYDDGVRALPGAVPAEKVVPKGILGTGFSDPEITAIGRSFANVWEPRAADGGADTKLSAMAGNSWGRLGAVASISYSYKERYREENQKYYTLGEGGALRLTNDYDFRYTQATATLGGVANLAYHFSDSHRLAFENFYTHSGEDEARVFGGYQDDKGVDLRNARLLWVQETILSSKLSGEHFFPGLANSRVDWSGVFSRATREEPDLRENLYEFNPSLDEFIWTDESQSGFRMFNDLTDDTLQGDANWSVYLSSFGGRFTSLKAGGAYLYRQRGFSSRRFRFKPRDTAGFDLTQAPEALFAGGNIGSVFDLAEDTRRTDHYDAEQSIAAGYLMGDLPLSEKLRIVGGVRLEYSDQNVTTSDLFDPTLPPIRSILQDTDLLPGVNLVYQLTPDQNLRAAYSHTLNRPEFRELAPYEFTDVVGGRAVVGNPGLRRALVRNADLRWEWFPAGGSQQAEVFAISAFYKDFQDPIERVVEATAALRTSYANAKGARNFGVELEARKRIGERLLVGANYAWIDSQIELEQAAGQVQTSLDRPLSGQSPNVLNGMLELQLGGGASLRALVNWFDDRISDVGALGIPDILEQGRVSLDVTASKCLGPYTLRISGDNLADAARNFTQGGALQRSYKDGRTLSVSLSYSR